jgi:hypothetical protein
VRRTVSALVDRDPAPGSPDSNRVEALVSLTGQYEAPFMQDPAQRSGWAICQGDTI